MRPVANCINQHIFCFWTKLITEVYLVSGSQDLELHSHRYESILAQKIQILLQKLSHAV